MKFTILFAGLLAGVALAGCVTDDNYQDSTMSPKPAEYPSVDASFLSAVEWRFVGPYRGGRVIAVAGGRLATGYTPLDRAGQRHALVSFQTRAIAPAAGYASTVEDLARFAAWQFRLLDSAWGTSAELIPGASILRPTTPREMQRVHRVDPELFAGEGSHWGLGFGIYPEDEQQTAETTFVGHGGACPGFRTSLRLQPDTKFAAIVMINAEGARASPGVITRAANKIVGNAIAEEGPDGKPLKQPPCRMAQDR
jgi:CubicO group peptidase (beta-lactamase class C family)